MKYIKDDNDAYCKKKIIMVTFRILVRQGTGKVLCNSRGKVRKIHVIQHSKLSIEQERKQDIMEQDIGFKL